jgi:hypothetical protein
MSVKRPGRAERRWIESLDPELRERAVTALSALL